jgi:geranylgeranyl diphosphate synthase type II
VAFQILNDLKDWQEDSDNKLVSGQDVLAGRPTLLLALALEGSGAAQRSELLEILNRRVTHGLAPGCRGVPPVALPVIERVRLLFRKVDVFSKAEKLVEKFRAKAEAIADEVAPTELRELLYFLVDTVLDGEPAEAPPGPGLPLIQLSS